MINLKLYLSVIIVCFLLSCGGTSNDDSANDVDSSYVNTQYNESQEAYNKYGVASVHPIVGIWYLHDNGNYRQYCFYEGGRFESWEGSPSDMKNTTGRFLVDGEILGIHPDNGEKAKVKFEIDEDTMYIKPTDDSYSVEYIRKTDNPINPQRCQAVWKSGEDNRLTLNADYTFLWENNNNAKGLKGTYVLISTAENSRLYLRTNDGKTTSYPALFTDVNGHRKLQLDVYGTKYKFVSEL